jgi:hypothetical protein
VAQLAQVGPARARARAPARADRWTPPIGLSRLRALSPLSLTPTSLAVDAPTTARSPDNPRAPLAHFLLSLAPSAEPPRPLSHPAHANRQAMSPLTEDRRRSATFVESPSRLWPW